MLQHIQKKDLEFNHQKKLCSIHSTSDASTDFTGFRISYHEDNL